MKTYIKPTIEFIELRAEERLATCMASINNMGHSPNEHICYNPNGKRTGHNYDYSKTTGPSAGTPQALGHCGPS